MKYSDRFSYQRSDRKAALALLAVMAVCAAIIFMVGRGHDIADAPVASDSAAVVAQADTALHRQDSYTYAVPVHEAELFFFDPNTADSTALLRLGLQPWQVRNIYKYRARGGVYRRKEDFARLYGLTAGQYKRMEPYIRISPDFLPATTVVDVAPALRDTLRYPVKLKEGEHIVLNTADTTELKRVPGIGSYYARAIVRYGQRLGGYVSTDQLDEIEGFPPESKSYFTIVAPQPRKINLNELSLNQLRRHPYISFYQAKAIIDYRRQHGALRSLADLKLHRDFTPEVISRLEPYVEF